VAKLNLYKLRAKVIVEDTSETLAVLAAWDGGGATKQGLSYAEAAARVIWLMRAARRAGHSGVALKDDSAIEGSMGIVGP